VKATPYAVVYSLFGGYVLPRGGEIWIGSLIQALAALDFSEKMVRTAISRMKKAGYLESHRKGQYSFYRLTKPGLEEVSKAGSRAIEISTVEWDGLWTVVTYSIPEEQRELRDVLRIRLKLNGFGSLVPGAWISPYPIPMDMENAWHETDVWRFLEVFRGKHVGSSCTDNLVAKAWPQIPTLASRYLAYKEKYERALRRYRKENFNDEKCFAFRLQSLFHLIAIILEDPGLPSALLPEDWPLPSSQAQYASLREEFKEPAERFFNEIFITGEVIQKR
jgi:phenylacetic acid degradation operon negative regulatory protein